MSREAHQKPHHPPSPHAAPVASPPTEKPPRDAHESVLQGQSAGREAEEKRSASSTQERVQQLERELHHMKDEQLRLLADVDNTKKRLHREQEAFVRYAAETMVRGLLPILDSLDQALVAVDKGTDHQAIRTGVQLIHRQFLSVLEREGVQRIPTVGERFDPHKHEAVAQVETTDGTVDETIVEEVQVGYTMHTKVIRPAIVKVAKKTTTSTQQSAVSTQKEQQSSHLRSGLGAEDSGPLPRAPNPKP